MMCSPLSAPFSCAGLRKTSAEEPAAPVAGSPGPTSGGGGAYCDFLGLPGTPAGGRCPPGTSARRRSSAAGPADPAAAAAIVTTGSSAAAAAATDAAVAETAAADGAAAELADDTPIEGSSAGVLAVREVDGACRQPDAELQLAADAMVEEMQFEEDPSEEEGEAAVAPVAKKRKTVRFSLPLAGL